MSIRVAQIVNPRFGNTFSGHSHYLFSLLSGWKDQDIVLGLLGTQLQVLNLNSGDRKYRLNENIWSNHDKSSRLGRILQIFKTISLLLSQLRRYDIFHFTGVTWGAILSPLFLHPLGKKVVFSMIRYGNDNPSYIINTKRGKIILSLLRQFDGVIGLSPIFAKECKDYGFSSKLITLPNFMAIPQLEREKEITQSLAHRSEFQIPSDALVLLYVGVAHERKGLDVLVDAYIELRKKYSNLWLIIVGPKNTNENENLGGEFLPQLNKKINDANAQKQVIWTGIISDLDKLSQYYWISDIFVLPTRSEGSPNVIAEAMYSELPVVVSNLVGITDAVINNKENGFLVTVNDTKSFVDVIDQLINDSDLRNTMGKNGRQRAIELFGFDQYCKKLKQFYIDIMN